MIMETIEYKGFNINIHYDDEYRNMSDFLSDEPITILSFDSRYSKPYTMHDSSKLSLPDSYHIIEAIQNQDDESLASELGFDIWQTEKRFALEINDIRYYKTREARFQAMLKWEEWQNLIIHSYRTQQGDIISISDQLELDSYAGMNGATPMHETIQHILDGEIYGYTIDDIDDSCWGFVGNSNYCLSEAKSVVDWHIEHERKTRIARVKQWIKNRVPLMYRSFEHV